MHCLPDLGIVFTLTPRSSEQKYSFLLWSKMGLSFAFLFISSSILLPFCERGIIVKDKDLNSRLLGRCYFSISGLPNILKLGFVFYAVFYINLLRGKIVDNFFY